MMRFPFLIEIIAGVLYNAAQDLGRILLKRDTHAVTLTH
jgi:hypothetical protein